MLAKWGAGLIWEMLSKSLVHVRVLWCAGGMDYGMSLSARREITKKEAGEYSRTSKKAKGEILDRLMVEIGWSRANARRQLGKAFKRCGPVSAIKRRSRPPTYGYDTVKVLQQVWVVAGQPEVCQGSGTLVSFFLVRQQRVVAGLGY